MADNLVQMQHVSKGPAGFTHGPISVESDDDGIIAVPAQLTGEALAHGFTTDVVEKAAPKVLAKTETKKEADGDKVKTAGGK